MEIGLLLKDNRTLQYLDLQHTLFNDRWVVKCEDEWKRRKKAIEVDVRNNGFDRGKMRRWFCKVRRQTANKWAIDKVKLTV